MTDPRLSALMLALLLPLTACGQSSGKETSDAASDAAVAKTSAEAPTAEPAAEAEGSEPAPRVLRTAPAGTQLRATLLESLDSENAEAGDRFAAELRSAITDSGRVLVPAGSHVLGRLTAVRRAQGDSAAVIAIDFDAVQVRGERLPINSTVTDVQMENRSEMRDKGKKIGIGAAVGAAIGAVAGDVKGAIIGAASGAAAGTAVALGTKAKFAVLPAGSEVTLRLDEPLEVRMPAEN